MKHEIFRVQIAGDDRPGLLARFSGAMARWDVEILDIGQAVIHESLNLGMLIRIPPQSHSAPVIKDLLFLAHDLDVKLTCVPIRDESYTSWVDAQGKIRHIITLLARRITAAQMESVAQVLSENDLNIDVITRLTGRAFLDEQEKKRRACIELSVRGTPTDSARMRREFVRIAQDLDMDIALQEDNAFRRNRRLVAFDMDSTLIQVEVVDELAKVKGVGDEVSRITERAMRGEIDFKESLRRRLRLLAGMDESMLRQVAESIPLNEGAQRLITNLQRFGYKIAIISGGFTYFGRRLQEMLDIDYVYANELEIRDGKITGEVIGDIVDAERKAELLRDIAERENLDLQQVVAVGDGANDLPMLNLAGLGIAYHAKPVVKEGAKQSISTLGLDSILYLMGMRDRDTID
jgi:phosphoserine phosphatase